MSRERRWHRVAISAFAVAALTGFPASAAWAGSVDGTLSGTTLSGDVVTTSLSLPPSAAGGAIDAS
ncbi:MAG TPA: hypothetical protein VFT93_05725, partial [Candidatus Eisenbacteria bacterium]|nr:hypothetical protein [Candidatus Eisenbacteria bacterium]